MERGAAPIAQLLTVFDQEKCQMKQHLLLTISSLLSILFTTFHLADDVVRGMEPGGLSTFIAVPILVVWLCGTLVLAERPSGYVIILLGSLLGLLVPVIHMKGAGVGGAIAKSSGAYFFIWTLLALGVTSLFSVILLAGAFRRAGWPRSFQRNTN